MYFGSGSWETEGTGKLQVYAFDQESAALSPVQELPVGDLNSFAAIDPAGKYLYATDEVGLKARSYAIDPADGKLSFVNEIDTSSGAVFSTLDGSRKYLFAAYYDAGGVEVFALGGDGTIGASVDSESTGPMAHSVALTPDNQFAFVPNLGSDEISQFAFDATSGALTANVPAAVPSGGDGPRHMAVHPSGLYAYVLNETDSQLTAYNLSGTSGTLAPIETVANVEGQLGQASSDIHITPDGKFLYASNREDDNTIAMYSIGSDGKLTSLGHEPSHGLTPHNFAIHPTSNVLLVGNRESSDVATFRILADGRLEFIESTAVGAAVFWVGFLLVPE